MLTCLHQYLIRSFPINVNCSIYSFQKKSSKDISNKFNNNEKIKFFNYHMWEKDKADRRSRYYGFVPFVLHLKYLKYLLTAFLSLFSFVAIRGRLWSAKYLILQFQLIPEFTDKSWVSLYMLVLIGKFFVWVTFPSMTNAPVFEYRAHGFVFFTFWLVFESIKMSVFCLGLWMGCNTFRLDETNPEIDLRFGYSLEMRISDGIFWI